MNEFIKAAYEQALKSYSEDGIPIGSVVVRDGRVVGAGHNQRIQKDSVILHGEMDALENTGRQTANFYRECTLYTTLSPCPMCSGTILLYGIPKVVIAENKTFQGEELLLKSRGVDVSVVDDPVCYALMQKFIAEKPQFGMKTFLLKDLSKKLNRKLLTVHKSSVGVVMTRLF